MQPDTTSSTPSSIIEAKRLDSAPGDERGYIAPIAPIFPVTPIAHWTHTLALCFVLLLTTIYGHMRSASATVEGNSHAIRYGSSLLLEWLLLGSVIAGIYSRRSFFLKAFYHPARTNMQSAALGFVVYVCGSLAILLVSLCFYFTPWGKKRNTDVVLAMLPHTPLQFLVWFGVSLTAGICEELIFRGYLLQQLTAWTKRPLLAILLAALLFGSVHLYEGVSAILPLAALAIVYGLVVRHFQGDLRAVIVAHTLQDFLVAVLTVAASYLKHLQPR